jgi:hypothetical protein
VRRRRRDGPTPSGGDTQTTSQACETVRASVQDAAAQVQRLDPGDPSSAVTAFDEVAARLDDAAQAVGNRSVADLLPPLRSGFTTASADLSAIAGGDLSRLASLQSAAAQIQSALSAFAAACPTLTLGTRVGSRRWIPLPAIGVHPVP